MLLAPARLSGVHPGISRRGLLRAAAAAAGLVGVATSAGCDLFGGSGGGASQPPAALTQLLDQTVALGDAYDGAITRVPSLASRLTGPRDAHRAHAKALAEALGKPAPATGGAAPGGSTDPTAVLGSLREQETSGVNAARQACLTGPDRFASLVGTIAAARACHLEVLK
jgi:hypothetical protein